MTEARPFQRRSRRPIPGVLVAVDAPLLSEKPWVVDAIDISSNGMGLVLPPEIAEDARVFLSFKLDKDIEFSRMPAVVRHQMSASGGVAFQPWPTVDRLRLLEFMVSWYERED